MERATVTVVLDTLEALGIVVRERTRRIGVRPTSSSRRRAADAEDVIDA